MASFQLNWVMPTTELMEKTFSAELVEAIRTTQVDRAEFSFWKVVLQNIQPQTEILLIPNNRHHFIQILESVLSSFAKSQILQNAAFFDSLVENGISDEFLKHSTIKEWLFLLCEQLIVASQNNRRTMVSSESSSGLPVFSQRGSSSSAISPPLTPNVSKNFPQLDGPTDFWGPVQYNNKIVQVNLEGPNLPQAWMSNETIVDPRRRATLSRLDELSLPINETPAEVNSHTYNGGHFVFHGTTTHFQTAPIWADRWYDEEVRIRGADTQTQLNPPGVPAVYTGFSALRCFLWAAFQGTIYQKIPTQAQISFMNRQWTARGNTFEGIAVLVFQPPASGNKYTSFTLPRDKGAAFENAVTQLRNAQDTLYPNESWDRLRWVHQSNTTEWPSVIHSAEHGQQLQFLRSWSVNKWRSAWAGTGIDTLNESYLFTMAITFQKKDLVSPPKVPSQPSASQPPSGKDDDEDKKKDKEKKTTLGRKMGKRLSMLFKKGKQPETS